MQPAIPDTKALFCSLHCNWRTVHKLVGTDKAQDKAASTLVTALDHLDYVDSSSATCEPLLSFCMRLLPNQPLIGYQSSANQSMFAPSSVDRNLCYGYGRGHYDVSHVVNTQAAPRGASSNSQASTPRAASRRKQASQLIS
eukprot:5371013-Amphidinium_carterae.1